jgi:DNA-binding protein HU-beta
MNKAQLVEQLAAEIKITKADCERVLDSTIEHIKKAVKKGDDVTLVGFGTFTKAKRKARMGRNPQTGEAIEASGMHCFQSSVLAKRSRTF